MQKSLTVNFRKELVALSIPLALQELLNALVGATDALMLGRLTQEAIAAVSLANQISFIMTLFITAVVGAAGVLAAQYYGKDDRGTVRQLLCMSLRYSFVIGILFFLAALLMPESLMRIFTNEPELIEIGADYLRIVSFSYLFSALSQCYLMVMKLDGRAKMSVWISLMTVVLDVVIDFFLIYGYGRIPRLGANGSAYSTIAVQLLAFLWCVLSSERKDRIRADFKGLYTFDGKLEKDLFHLEIPRLASSLSWGLSISVHSAVIGHLGINITAAYSVTSVAIGLIQCLTMGFAAGASIVIGGLLGKNDMEKAKAYGARCLRVAIQCGIANAILIGLIGPMVYYFYVLSAAAKTFLIQMLLFNILYMFAGAFNAIFACGVFPAGGDFKYDAVSVFFATWCFAIPLCLIGLLFLHWPPMLVYVVMCADEIIKTPFLIPRYKKYIWLKNLT